MTEPAQHPAGLQLFTSNRLETLAALLAEAARVPLASPFEPEVVVVQSQGMARWLQFELARRLGVCAHVQFPFPKGFAWKLFRAADSGLAAEPDPGTESLAWRLMQLLPEHAPQDGFESVAHYLANDADGRKRFQLARRLAHLFDQYLVYRPEMILRWENHQVAAGEEWQAALWRALARDSTIPNPARLRSVFTGALRSEALPAGTLPSRLSIFGISVLPPFYVELFEELARHIPVSMFLLQPTAEYWGDVDSARSLMRSLRRSGRAAVTPSELHHHAGNRLLASLGNQGRDFLNVLLDVTEFDSKDHSESPGEASLLQSIQSDIFELRDREAEAGAREEGAGTGGRMTILASDDSVQIHCCHSPVRELEVLRDQMLAWFEADPALAPQDILVMMPDIETYAPFVEAVFGAGERDRHFIPFSIADRGSSASSHVLSSFLALLQLAGGRLGASSVLALLEAQSIRARFGLAESDLPLARRWIEDSGIRWGRDAAHRAQLGLPALPENTWRQGLDRLRPADAPPIDGPGAMEGALPGDGVESRKGEALGFFAEFAETVFSTVAQLEQKRPVAAWVALFRDMTKAFFIEDDSTEEELRVLRIALKDLETQVEVAGFEEPISLAILLEHLVPALAEDHLHTGFITGRVTFGALKPMRSIPFKIICLVGMDDGAFPRADTRTGFDLMSRAPRLGDQSRREDDRYLFLETLLSARRRLYLSYVGQSVRDNSPAPPSVLVSELLDYIDQNFSIAAAALADEPQPPADLECGVRTVRGHVVIAHRLQAFNEEYFVQPGRLFSYSAENFAACLALRRTATAGAFVPRALPPPPDSWRTVTVDQLAGFFGNPARFFATERLNLKLPRPKSAISDREPIEKDALENYDLKTELLELRLGETKLIETLAMLKAEGKLPLGRVGDARHRELCDEVEAFHERLAPFHPEQRAAAGEIDLVIGEFRVQGSLPAATPSGPLLFRPATLKAKDLVRAWVTHILWQVAAGPAAGRTILVGERAKEKKERSIVAFGAVPDAAGILANMLGLYWRGLSEPLRFFPATSLAFVEADPEEAFSEARKAWRTDDHHRGEESDDYVALCFSRVDPLDSEFALNARAVFLPLLKQQEVLE